jgi:hypothetical protein
MSGGHWRHAGAHRPKMLALLSHSPTFTRPVLANRLWDGTMTYAPSCANRPTQACLDDC